MKKKDSILEGGVARSLVVFTLPILFALLLQVMYGSVDMLIVGNFATIQDLSGVSTGSQLTNTLTALCTGLAMGATILIGQKKGEKRDQEIGPIISNSIFLFLALSIAVMSLILGFIDEIVAIMNTPEDARIATHNYIFYSAIGIPMIFAYNVLGSIFRGLGDSKTPLLAVGIACIVNIFGDLILVAGLNMGSSGAAIATVVAQTISVVISIFIIRKRRLFNYNMRKNLLKIDFGYINRVIVLGSPIALQSVLTSLSFLFVTLIVNQFGVIYSAAVGVTEKLTGIIMLIPLSFMQSMSVFVAQNYGAQNYRRVKRGMFVGIAISFAFGVVMFYLSFFNGDHLISIFNQDRDVVAAATTYIKVYAIDTLLVPILFCMTGYFNGCGRTMFVMIQGIIGAIGIRLTLTYFLSMVEPLSLFTIGLATPAATIIQIIMCIVYFYIIDKKIRSELSGVKN